MECEIVYSLFCLYNSSDSIRFLWVVLQIDSICIEKTDESIRRVLNDLPKGLSATFSRILARSKQPGRCYQRDILRILVGAYRPLTIAEIREALSVIPGDTSWEPGLMINNAYTALNCCGSLLTTDEEDETVGLIHQSVVQFLLGNVDDSRRWHFTTEEADSYLGDITVTYLNYGVFEQRVSTKLVSKFHTRHVSKTILQNVLQPRGTIGQIALSFLQPQSQINQDIRHSLAHASNIYRHKQHAGEDFHFLRYASDNWLQHTRTINQHCTSYLLWRRLLSNPRFSHLPWSSGEPIPHEMEDDAVLGVVWKLAPRVTWAIYHSHVSLLSLELRSRYGIKAMCSVIPYLTSFQGTTHPPRFSLTMCERLLRISTVFKASSLTDWLLQMCGYTLDEYIALARNMGLNDYGTIRWILHRQPFGRFDKSKEALVETAYRNDDFRTVRFLIGRGAKVDAHYHEQALLLIWRKMFQEKEDLFLSYYHFRGCTNVPPLTPSQLYYGLHASRHFINLQFFNPFEKIASLAILRQLDVLSLYENLLHSACKRGDYVMAETLLPHAKTHFSLNELLLAALHSLSLPRQKIVRLLLHGNPDLAMLDVKLLVRCAQLRDWVSAKHIVERTDANDEFSSYVRRKRVFQHSVDAQDTKGIEFLFDYTDVDVHGNLRLLLPSTVRRPGAKHDSNNVTPLQVALDGVPISLEGFCDVLGFAVHSTETQVAHPLTDSAELIDKTLVHISLLCRSKIQGFLSEAQPWDSDENSLDYAATFIQGYYSKMKCVDLMETLLQHQKCQQAQARHELAETLVQVLRAYSTAVLAIRNVRRVTWYNDESAKTYIQRSNNLKLGFVRLAVVILRTLEPHNSCEDLNTYISAHLNGTDRHLDGTMEYVLLEYGIPMHITWAALLRGRDQEQYVPPLFEAAVLGQPLLKTAGRMVKDGARMDQGDFYEFVETVDSRNKQTFRHQDIKYLHNLGRFYDGVTRLKLFR